MRKRIAIVGGGVAGLTSAYLLSRRHDVTLFEAESRLGGHAHSVEVEPGIFVDTAFLIFNSHSYPRFLKLLSRLGVTEAVRATDMSMGFHNRRTGAELVVNDGLGGLFARRRSAFSPAHWKLLAEIARFRRRAAPAGFTGNLGEVSGSRRFVEEFLLPLGASVWSLPSHSVAEMPARLFHDFFAHHKALKRERGARWLTLKGGSRRYIDAFPKTFEIRLGARVRTIRRDDRGVEIEGRRFDECVVATHADQALGLLAEPSQIERRLLGAWRYEKNPAILHTDTSILPRRSASWNISHAGDRRFAVTYDLERIQRPGASRRYLVTLGAHSIPGANVIRRFDWRHPIFTLDAPDLAPLDGARHTHFCGSYFGRGFHEDALASACTVASRFGLEL